MKKIVCLILSATVLIFSCKKSSSPSGPTIDATQYYVSAVKTYNPGYLGIDSFTYNSDHLLSRYAQYTFDSTGSQPATDSLIVDFSFSTNSKAPSSYTMTEDGVTDQGHQLFYDAQDRIVQDSNLNGTMYVTNYGYPGNNLAADVNFYFFSSTDRKDTLLFKSGDMSNENIYYPNAAGTGDSLADMIDFTHSSYGNPVYHPEISGPIGHLLFLLAYDGFQNYSDYNSKHLVNSAKEIQAGAPSVQINYGTSTDSKGRVSQVTVNGVPASVLRVTFSYY